MARRRVTAWQVTAARSRVSMGDGMAGHGRRFSDQGEDKGKDKDDDNNSGYKA